MGQAVAVWCAFDPCLGSHASEKGIDHPAPEFKDDFLGGFLGKAMAGNGCSVCHSDADLDKMGLEEMVEMVQCILLFVDLASNSFWASTKTRGGVGDVVMVSFGGQSKSSRL